jgi:hypothetical protein
MSQLGYLKEKWDGRREQLRTIVGLNEALEEAYNLGKEEAAPSLKQTPFFDIGFKFMPERAQDHLLRFWNQQLEDWKKLCLRLYKEHVGDNSFDMSEKDWEGLMKEARERLVEAGLLKDGA